MDNIPEREQSKQERVIHLGQEFHPFDLNATEKSQTELGPILRSDIVVNLEDIKIPFSILAIPSKSHQSYVFTPFDPELGYHIDPDDLNFDTRVKKFKNLQSRRGNIDFSKAPNYIEFRNTFSNNDVPISQVVLELIEKMRLYVLFPMSTYESKPNGEC